MDCHIEEHTAADCRILRLGRLRVSRCDFDDVNISDFTFVDHCSDIGKVMVETAVETDLEFYSAFLDGINYRSDFFGSQVNGLLTENMFAGFCRFNRYIRVSVG